MKDLIAQIPRSKSDVTALVVRVRSSPAIMSAFWVIFAAVGSQGIRLISNLIMTRLLVPEIFGIMALVHAVNTGLGQLSDVGLREGVVNSDRINDPKFMNTAWTLQIIRTALIALGAIAIAYPLANMYDEEILAPVLIMTGFATFITGFKSIGLLAYDKRLDLKHQMLVDMVVAISGISFALIWAYFSPTVWALVGGHILASTLDVVLSYTVFKGHFSKLAWEKKATRDLFKFGKWIFLSSTISFIAVQADKLVMGAWMTMDQLGQYSIASTWSMLVMTLSFNLSTRVLHPFFKQSLDKHQDFSQIHRTRLQLNLIYTVVCLSLALLGTHLVELLYDERYQEAGWMLQILAIGQIGRALTGTLRPFLLASGDSFSQMAIAGISAVILVVMMMLGAYFAGVPGIIIAFSLSGVVAHPVMVVYAHRHGYHCMRSDVSILLAAMLAAVLGWWFSDAVFIDILMGIGRD